MRDFIVIIPYMCTVYFEHVYSSIIFPSHPLPFKQCLVGFIMLLSYVYAMYFHPLNETHTHTHTHTHITPLLPSLAQLTNHRVEFWLTVLSPLEQYLLHTRFSVSLCWRTDRTRIQQQWPWHVESTQNSALAQPGRAVTSIYTNLSIEFSWWETASDSLSGPLAIWFGSVLFC
jgi:hypothetical protein